MDRLWSCHSICQVAGQRRRFSRSFRELLDEASFRALGCPADEGLRTAVAAVAAVAVVVGVPAVASVVYVSFFI